MDSLLFENGQKNAQTFYWGESDRAWGAPMTCYLKKENKTKKAKLTRAQCFDRFGCG